MRLATFNVENMFDRAKALNQDTWVEGKPALDAHAELNKLFEKVVYSAADKQRMLKLLGDHGLLKTDEGPLLILRKVRGKLLNRPRTGTVTVQASGRDDWIGWIELKTEPVKEAATENTARVIATVAPDILAVIEAEDRTTLRLFNEKLIPAVGASSFDHVMVIDGNDDRGIDVGILTRSTCPIVSIRSHVDDTDQQGEIFSRDCAEYEINLPSGARLWVLVNHMKSKGFGRQSDNDAKRFRQAKRVREIYEAHLTRGDDLIAIVGDFNDTPDSAPLKPLLADGSTLRDVSEFAGFDDGGRPGTHGNCTASSKIDYVLLSPALFNTITAAGIERRGMWGGKNGTLWPHFAEVKSADDVASDHAAVWVDLGS